MKALQRPGGAPSAAMTGDGRRREIGVAAVLAIVTFAVFLPGLTCGFVALDDPQSVTRYTSVLQGLTWDGWRFAWTEQYFGHWVPVTLLTVMVDWELWGRWAPGHHLTNQLLHAANAALVFLVLHRFTGATWRAAAVALLFAVHPLRVEPVLWLTGRKDLLSATWSLVALLLYARWREAPGRLRYAGVAIALVFALLSKATAVVVPVLMLLVDVWPLDRLRESAVSAAGASGTVRVVAALVREKLPLFALAALTAAAAVASARAAAAMAPLEVMAPATRLANAVVVYGRSLAQTVWPRGLAAFYPLPADGFPPGKVALATVVLVLISATVVLAARRAPWVVVGWLWWLVCILPVSGVVQAGEQAGADRYTYLASVGLLLAGVWTAARLAAPLKRSGLAGATALAVALAACTVATWRLIPSWRDTGALFTRAAAVTEGNYFAHLNLGSWYLQQGDLPTAVRHLRIAADQAPALPLAWTNLGSALRRQGDRDGARHALIKAIQIDPAHRPAHLQLAALLEEEGALGPAVGHLAVAISIEPRDPIAWRGLADLLTRPGAAHDALPYLTAVARERPSPQLEQLLESVRRAAEVSGPPAAPEAAGDGALNGSGSRAPDPQ